MSDHLPECPADPKVMPVEDCIYCPSLRACEARVTERIRTGVTGLGHSPIYLTDLLAVIDGKASA